MKKSSFEKEEEQPSGESQGIQPAIHIDNTLTGDGAMDTPRRFRIFLIACLLAIAGSTVARSQGQEATITDPADSARNVSLSTAITVRTVFPIDSSSIIQHYKLGEDTNAVWRWPTVTVVPRTLTDTLYSDSLIQYHAISGTYDLEDDTTLTFTPTSNLAPNTWYVAAVRSLSVVVDTVTGTGGVDTIAVDVDSVTFLTAPNAHRIITSSLSYDRWIGCEDSIWVQFNRQLDSSATTAGPIIKVYRYDSVKVDVDTIYTVHTTEISTDVEVVGPDSSRLLILPSEMTPGASYQVDVNTYLLSGDSLNNATYEYNVRGDYALTVSVENQNGAGSTPPDNLILDAGEHRVSDGEIFTLVAATEDSTFTFVKWHCPTLPGVHNSNNPKETILATCGYMSDLDVKAIYCEKGALSLTVTDTTHMWVAVYQYDQDTGTYSYLGGAGSYSVGVGESFRILSGADSGSGMMFSAWKSDDDDYDGEESAMIDIRNNGRLGKCGIGIEIGPDFPWVEPTIATCCLDIEAVWDYRSEHLGRQPEIDIEDVLSIVPGLDFGHNVNDPSISGIGCDRPQQVTFSADNCFEISGVWIVDKNGQTLYLLDLDETAGIGSWNSAAAPNPDFDPQLPISPTNPQTISVATAFQNPRCMDIWVGVRPTGTYELEIFTELDDPRVIEPAQIGQERDVRVTAYVLAENGTRREIGVTPNKDTKWDGIATDFSESYVVDAFCGERIEVIAEYNFGEVGYEFLGWSDDNPYQYPTTLTDESFVVTMNSDKSVRAVFEEQFRLRKAGFFIANQTDANSNEPEYKDFRSWGGTQDVNVWIDYENQTHYGTKAYFLFNDEPSKDDLEALSIVERSERIDWPHDAGVDRATRGAWGLESSTGSVKTDEGYLVVMTLLESGDVEGIVRGMIFDVEIAGDLENTNADPIYTAEKISMETEMPGVEILVDRIRARDHRGFDDTDPELFTLYTGGIGNESAQDVTEEGRLPVGTPGEVDVDVWQYYISDGVDRGKVAGSGQTPQFKVVEKNKALRDDVATLMLKSYDMDGSNVDDEVESSWEEVAAYIISIGVAALTVYLMNEEMTDEEEGLDPGQAFAVLLLMFLVGTSPAWVPALIAVLTVFLQSFGTDDPYGDRIWSYQWEPNKWFGAHPDADAQQTGAEADGVEYDVEFRLKR